MTTVFVPPQAPKVRQSIGRAVSLLPPVVTPVVRIAAVAKRPIPKPVPPAPKRRANGSLKPPPSWSKKHIGYQIAMKAYRLLVEDDGLATYDLSSRDLLGVRVSIALKMLDAGFGIQHVGWVLGIHHTSVLHYQKNREIAVRSADAMLIYPLVRDEMGADDAMFTQARRDSRTIEIRRRVWCEMRRRGCSYGAIARVCGMSHSSVMLAVQLADKSS